MLLGAGPNKNVVMMVTDDQGLQAGCYGDPVIQTPNIDRLADQGTRFNHAYCTTSSCSASRSVILTGLYNHANGQYGHAHSFYNFHTHRWVKSLPLLLRQAGYKTCITGKFHLKPTDIYKFDVFAKASARHPVNMAVAAEKFIRQNHKNPFFVYYCTADPHREVRGFSNKNRPGIKSIEYDPQKIPVPPYLPDRPEIRADLAQYYQAVSRADQGVGRLLKAIEDTGHWDDTLIIFLSDNGLPFPMGKTNLYEPGARLPLVVRSPNQQKRGIATNAMVTWADLTPTILEYAGAQPPQKYQLQGRSFLSILDQTDPPGWDEIYLSHSFHETTMYYPMRVVRQRKYKYILNLVHQLPYPVSEYSVVAPTWQILLKMDNPMLGKRTLHQYYFRSQHELYDLSADPREENNLAQNPKYAHKLKTLQNKLQTWRVKTKDPWLAKHHHQ
ncbi:MAG: sulfatase family protein [Planctomycetota bacterium]|jgi:N-sulfoglucosamine sulfohydrolase